MGLFGGLPPLGVKAVVDNYGDFIDKMGGMAAKTTATKGVIAGLGSVSLGGIVTGAGVAVAAVAAIGVAAGVAGLAIGGMLLDIAEKTAPLLDIKQAFEALTARAGKTADATLAMWQDATRGTVPAIKLMEIYNTSVRQLGDTMTEQLPAALPLLRDAAEATGQDFTQFASTLIRGIGRMRVGTLAQIGVTIDAEQVYSDYATSIGKTADALTDEEKKAALFAASIQQLTADTEGLRSTGLEADDAFERWRTTIEDTKTDVKIAITEAMLPLAVQFSELAKQYLPAVVAVFQTQLIPILSQVVTWLVANLPGAIAAAVTFFGNLQSAAGEVGNFWTTVLQPALAAVWTAIITQLAPALTLMAANWTNVVLPALKLAWQWFSQNILPSIVAVANVVSAVLGFALRVLWAFIQNKLIPVLSTVWGWISEKLGPVFKALGEALVAIRDILQPVWDLLANVADTIRNMEIPAWLQGHSPSPFENTLAGIRDTLMQINSIAGPTLGAGRLSPLAVASGGATGGGGDTFNPEYNLAIHTSAPREQVAADFGLMQALSRRR